MRGRERSLWKRAVRRLKSSRASAYLEYAVVLPLVVLSISALIEFAAFWDAKIMANHAAWTCARIASVEAGQKDVSEDEKFDDNRLKTMGMKTATAMLMSTCAMGSMQGSAKGFVDKWYKELVTDPLAKFEKDVVEHVKSFGGEGGDISKKLGGLKKFAGFDAMSKVVDASKDFLVDELKDLLVNSLLNPMFTKVNKAVEGFFKPIREGIENAINGNRSLRQIAYATGRVKEDGRIITVREREDMAFGHVKTRIGASNDTRIDYPRCLDDSAKCDNWFVRSDSPWPPNNQQQRMIDVTIRWPFERAWLFPVISSGKGAKVDSRPTAVGRALFYPQPAIKNEHLKSEGAEKFMAAKEEDTRDVDRIKNKFTGFLKVAALYYHYQLGDEEVGPYDSKSAKSGSYKGIGLGISGGADEGKIYKNDGLVFWMDRAPDNTRDHDAWKRKSPPADYISCFQSITGTKDETCYFWAGVAFLRGTQKHKALESFENHAYRRWEWFYWMSDEMAHLRRKHNPGWSHNSLYSFYPDEKNSRNTPSFSWKETKRTVLETFLVKDDGVLSYSDRWIRGMGSDFDHIGIEGLEYYGGGMSEVAPYNDYKRMVWKHSEFEISVRNMISARRPDLLKDCTDLEHAADEIFNKKIPKLFDDTLDLMGKSSKELDDAMSSDSEKGLGGGTDSQNFFDIGEIDTEKMSPKEIAKAIEDKLNALKKEVFKAIQEIDQCEKELRDFYLVDTRWTRAKQDSWIGGLMKTRDRDLVAFARLVGRTIKDLDGANNPSLILEWLRKRYPWKDPGPLAVSQELKKMADKALRLSENYYNAQVKLAKLLNLSAARPKLNVLGDDKTQGFSNLGTALKDSTLPKVSGAASGSDDDGAGDLWTYDSKEGLK